MTGNPERQPGAHAEADGRFALEGTGPRHLPEGPVAVHVHEFRAAVRIPLGCPARRVVRGRGRRDRKLGPTAERNHVPVPSFRHDGHVPHPIPRDISTAHVEHQPVETIVTACPDVSCRRRRRGGDRHHPDRSGRSRAFHGYAEKTRGALRRCFRICGQTRKPGKRARYETGLRGPVVAGAG
jgi:hypothetical protein